MQRLTYNGDCAATTDSVVIALDESLEPQKPHRQVWFCGAASINVLGTEFTLLTRRNAVTIKEQPFVAQLRPRKDLFPAHLDLDSRSNHQVLAWFVIDRADLLKPAVVDMLAGMLNPSDPFELRDSPRAPAPKLTVPSQHDDLPHIDL